MNYTKRDIEKAIRLKSEGYNWIAKNKAGRPFAFGRIPYRYADDSNEYSMWNNQLGTPWLMLSKDEFASITWENEPVYIDEIITEGKVQANGDTAIDRLIAENARLKEEVDSLSHENDELEYKTEKLEDENAKLKARLERAIELPYVKRDCELTQIIYKNSYGDMEEETYFHDCYYGERHDVRGDVYAEARLAELGGKTYRY